MRQSVVREVFPAILDNVAGSFDRLAVVPARKVVTEAVRCLLDPVATDAKKLEAAEHLTCLLSLGHISRASVVRSLNLMISNSNSASPEVKSKLAVMLAFFDPTREHKRLDSARLAYLKDGTITDTALIGLLRVHYPYTTSRSVAQHPLSTETKKAILDCLFSSSPSVLAETIDLIARGVNGVNGYNYRQYEGQTPEFYDDMSQNPKYRERLINLLASSYLDSATIDQINFIITRMPPTHDPISADAILPEATAEGLDLPIVRATSSTTTLATTNLVTDTLRHSVSIQDFFNKLPKQAIIVVQCFVLEEAVKLARALGKITSNQFRVIAPHSNSPQYLKFNTAIGKLGQLHELHMLSCLDAGASLPTIIYQSFRALLKTRRLVKDLLRLYHDKPVIIFGQVNDLMLANPYSIVTSSESLVRLSQGVRPEATCLRVQTTLQKLHNLFDPKHANAEVLSSQERVIGNRVIDLLSAKLGRLPVKPDSSPTSSLPVAATASALLILDDHKN